MKTFAICLAVATTLAAGAAGAQTAQPVAAGRIQNTFDASGRATTVNTPTPAVAANPLAEPAIRAFIGGLQTGTVDWNAFTPNLAEQMRPVETEATEVIRGLGALESVEWMQSRDAVDLFLVRFEQADTQWVIGFDDGGKIAALLFRPAPPIVAEAATAENVPAEGQ